MTEYQIIHVDMDAFFASVEQRDDPALRGKPLIIGSLPGERGVVSTCSYEARRYGVRSAMNIAEAYRRCPHGIYKHPDMKKYLAVSAQLHKIWQSYAETAEFIACDEAYLDVTSTAPAYGGAVEVGRLIKERTLRETGLTCSVGVAYSMAAAKLASEEKKPDGFFVIPTPEKFVELIADRDVRVLAGVGEKSAERLRRAGILTVRDVQQSYPRVRELLGKFGEDVFDLSFGIDRRRVTHYEETDAKSLGREVTFQRDTDDFSFLSDVLDLLAWDVSRRLSAIPLYGRTVTLKITYADMRGITRSRGVECGNRAADISAAAQEMLASVERKKVRLIGVSMQNLSPSYQRQLTLDDLLADGEGGDAAFSRRVDELCRRYGETRPDRDELGERLYATIEKMERERGDRTVLSPAPGKQEP
ncbi:MAG: DNA polymerase IV, partial [Clostridia bacterium]|nr:DNA polymerase IV [Clostridia bacterium]